MLLAFHDAVLDRVTDATGAIATSTYAEVQRALINGSDPVPTLAELFDAFPDARFNIDLKSRRRGPALAAFLDERQAWDRVCVGSFSGRRLRGSAASREGGWRRPRARSRWRRSGSCPPRVARLVTRGRPQVLQVPHRRGPLTIVTPGSYAAPTRRASRCTSGPSTTPRR